MPDLNQIITVVGYSLMGLLAAMMGSLGLAALWTWRDWPGADRLTGLAARLAILTWMVGGVMLVVGGLAMAGLATWVIFWASKPLPSTLLGIAGYVASRAVLVVMAVLLVRKGVLVLAAWWGARKEKGAPEAPGATARKE
ncbi:hypothetical protein J2W25_003025 [Variovorax boronicumulans]|uniref:Uncharacterized protein n=1 Tax=Variovorax boronicumulans TaxID=436515 RepID=A0AAW8DWX3_9BURK|nr:hypothetical protein [Variovorax boronicumulans]MDP9878709.1 hypothetical protein [Variovorax boronicumulans]MDP9923993.1 hypothetical protein [Variovorax boronicumulans]